MARLTIDVTQEDLLDLKVGACICGIHRSKKLDKGKLSSRISSAAGPNLQKQLDSKTAHRDFRQGEVSETRPENLSSKFKVIYFVCLRSWQEGNDEDLQGAIERILDDAGSKKLTSVALPALGTGGLKYPPRKVAFAILQAAMAYSIDNPNSSLSCIKVSLFEQRDEMLQAFTDILMKGVSVYEALSNNQVTDGQTTAVDNVCQSGDQNSNRLQDINNFLARPLVPRSSNANMFGWLWSYFGKSPPVYSFLVGPVPVSVGPHVSVTPNSLTIGVTFSTSSLPAQVKTVLSTLFNRP